MKKIDHHGLLRGSAGVFLGVVATALMGAGCASMPAISLPFGTGNADAPRAVAAVFERARQDRVALARFMRAMPKGGDIHHHLIGAPTPAMFVEIGARRGFCLDPESLAATAGPCDDASVPFAQLDKRPALVDRLTDAWSMRQFSGGDALAPAHFFGVFPQIWSLSEDRGLILAALKRQAAEENVLYLETQLQTPSATDAIRDAAMRIGIGDDVLALRDRLLASGELSIYTERALSDLKRYDETAQRDLGCETQPEAAGCAVTHRYQIYALRILPPPMVLADMILAFEVADRAPDVVGVNVVGFEGDGNSLLNYDSHMEALGALKKIYDDVPLALHAGEITSREAGARALENHVPAAVYVAGADRIGHGNAIATSANQKQLLRDLVERGITVELSLTSNELLLGLVGDQHHLPLLRSAGVTFTLNTDDAGIFGTDLTREYTLAADRYPQLGYADFKRLSRQALESSFLAGTSLWVNIASAQRVSQCSDLWSAQCDALARESDKARLQRELEQRFRAFEQQVVDGGA